jgi:hypothetical protein
MVTENLPGFQSLKARNLSIERDTAAFCSRVEMVTVVIGVSLVRQKAYGVKILRRCAGKLGDRGMAGHGILIARWSQ